MKSSLRKADAIVTTPHTAPARADRPGLAGAIGRRGVAAASPVHEMQRQLETAVMASFHNKQVQGARPRRLWLPLLVIVAPVASWAVLMAVASPGF